MEAPRHPARSARRTRSAVIALVTGVAASALVLAASPAPAGATTLPVTVGLVSRSAAGVPATLSSSAPSLSDDGRFVAFTSTGNNLVTGDGNGLADVFVKDRWSQAIERVSVTDAEATANGTSNTTGPSISDDGRYVVFRSNAANLIANDDKGLYDPFVRDRVTGQTIRVAAGFGGALLNGPVDEIAISGNGRYVAFTTNANNLVANDTNGDVDVFVRDLYSNDVERVSLSFLDGQADGNSSAPSLSDDGRYVAFGSQALLAGGQIGAGNVYVRDRTAGTTVMVNVNSAEEVDDTGSGTPMISGNGRYVAFGSNGTNLAPSDTNGTADIFRRDLQAGTTARASISDADLQLPTSSFGARISDDGSQVGFVSRSKATGATDAGDDADFFVRSFTTAATRRMTTGTVADPAGNVEPGPDVSGDGLSAAFVHPLGLTGDNKAYQVYVNDRPSIGPATTADAFIDQQFLDFLGRPAFSGERISWNDKFKRGSATPITLIATLAADPAFAGKRAPVVRLYWAFFLRKPDPSGLTYWTGKFQNGTSLSSIAQKFSQSSEFKNRYGTLTNQQFVKLIYPNIFERQPDPSGLDYWTGKLDRKESTRGAVITGFSESSEGVRRLAPQVNITLISQGMLRVSPSPAFWDAAFAVYQGGEKELAWLAGTTLDSPAYIDLHT